MVAGTPRCTTCFAAVQDGNDRAAQALSDAAQRLAQVGEADGGGHHGFSGAIAATMHYPSCRRDVGSVPEAHEGAVRDPRTADVI
jgi:hypothetical protein